MSVVSIAGMTLQSLVDLVPLSAVKVGHHSVECHQFGAQDIEILLVYKIQPTLKCE